MKIASRVFFVCLLVIASSAIAQVKVRFVGPRYVPPTDGKQLYAVYCAGCHGENLTAAAAVKQTVAHNTELSEVSRYHPRDVAFSIQTKLEYGSEIPEHQASMPSWRSILRKAYSGDDGKVALAIHNLTDYIVSHQQTIFRTTGVSNQK